MKKQFLLSAITSLFYITFSSAQIITDGLVASFKFDGNTMDGQ